MNDMPKCDEYTDHDNLNDQQTASVKYKRYLAMIMSSCA